MATVSIPATADVGDVLTPTISPAETVVTAYAWLVESDTVSVSSTFTVRKIDQGKVIRVSITYTDNEDTATTTSYGCSVSRLPTIDTSVLRSGVHLRGGDGVTIVPDGDCSHGGEGEQIAKVNWDGMYTYDSGGGTPYRPAGSHWYREIAFGTGITPTFKNDSITISGALPTLTASVNNGWLYISFSW